jgi:peptide deformylase
MAIRKIIQLGDPRLREKAQVVGVPAAPEVAELITDLQDTLAHSRATTGYGRGIAAPQLGIMQRVIFLKLPGRDPWALINPEITVRSPDKIVVWDTCLSFLSIFMQVERNREITVRFQDPTGEWQQILAAEAEDLSELLQHEIDHLDGILCIDRVTDVKTICSREEFEKRYSRNTAYAARD